MKYTLMILFLWIPLWSKESKIKILVMKTPIPSQLPTVVWNECRGCNDEELRVILDCIKNRIEHEDFPDSLDSVLNQSNQFKTIKKGKQVSIKFIKRVDSLWKLPRKYPYLYFRSSGYKKSSWMLQRIWVKHKSFKHEFAY